MNIITKCQRVLTLPLRVIAETIGIDGCLLLLYKYPVLFFKDLLLHHIVKTRFSSGTVLVTFERCALGMERGKPRGNPCELYLVIAVADDKY